ncbi:hypothetical protein HAX54_049314 [Datura stramonium]|uniref:Uncharacterized protein n=1 Tax=Datura stramonium TaxID=4076 RepID=A0ABS8SVD0_DATST|nr:hypothetical protein [Datura stramonium]
MQRWKKETTFECSTSKLAMEDIEQSEVSIDPARAVRSEWTPDNEYKDYAIDGIIIKDYVSYDGLVGAIMKQLKIDDIDKKLR